MKRKVFLKMIQKYESPAVTLITASVERGFAISFEDDDLFFGEEGAAGGDFLDEGFFEL